MLVVSRFENEDVVIGEGANEVRVRIAGVFGKKVRLGVIAPPHVRVDRCEVRKRREAEALENETRRLCVGEGLA